MPNIYEEETNPYYIRQAKIKNNKKPIPHIENQNII
jgi:hypothetical protein